MTSAATLDATVRAILRSRGHDPHRVRVTRLESFDNLVVRVEHPDGAASVVRATSTSRRTGGQVRAERDLVMAADRRGVLVPLMWGEPIETGGRVVVEMPLLPGVADPGTLRGPRAGQLGDAMAALHAVAVDLGPDVDRPRWRESDYLRLRELDGVVEADLAASVLALADDLDAAAGTLGPVHADLGSSNLLFGPERLAVIDFDDSCVAEAEFDVAVWLHRHFVDRRATAAEEEAVCGAWAAGYAAGGGRRLSAERIEGYLLVLLAQTVLVVHHRPGCPGLDAGQALERLRAGMEQDGESVRHRRRLALLVTARP